MSKPKSVFTQMFQRIAKSPPLKLVRIPVPGDIDPSTALARLSIIANQEYGRGKVTMKAGPDAVYACKVG